MKKLLVFFWVLILVAPLFSAQMFVVGEVLTETWCGFCPNARAAFRTMANDPGTYPYFIPLIWQGNGNYPSPNYSNVYAEYVTPLPPAERGIPHARFGGSRYQVGAGATVINSYQPLYNAVAATNSPISIEIIQDRTDDVVLVTANIDIEGSISHFVSPKVAFVVTYNLDGVMDVNYFASVARYAQQTFNESTTSYSESFTYEDWWEDENIRIVVWVQDTGGTRLIHNAAIAEVYPAAPVPRNFNVIYSYNQVNLSWEIPNDPNDPDGYKIYRNDTQINTGLVTGTSYIDNPGENGLYEYQVSAVYAGGSYETERTAVAQVEIADGLVQFGGGKILHPSNEEGPVNTTSRSLRGQFIYRTDEFANVGISGAKDITSIALFVEQAPNLALPEFHVRLANTNNSSVEIEHISEFSSTTIIPLFAPIANQWNIIELDEPFKWDGSSNIVIDTAFNRVASSSASGIVRINIESSPAYRYYVSSLTNTINSTTQYTRNYKPQLRFYCAEPTPDEEISNPSFIIKLGNNYPNPFNPSTTISFELNEPSSVKLSVYNIKGQLVKVLTSAIYGVGKHYVEWDGTDESNKASASGVYMYTLQSSGTEETKRMLLMK